MLIDGQFTMYLIQGLATHKGKEKHEWFFPSFDYFPTPTGFCTSDECWQLLGIHGSFDEGEAVDGARMLARFWPEYDWRVVKRTIYQRTVPSLVICARTPGKRKPEEDVVYRQRIQEANRYREEVKARRSHPAKGSDTTARRDKPVREPRGHSGRAPNVVRRPSRTGPKKARVR